MKTYYVSSTSSDLVIQYDFFIGDSGFNKPKPVSLKGYKAKLILECTKQVLVNQKSQIIEFSSDDTSTIVQVKDNKVFIQLSNETFTQSLYRAKLTLESAQYRLPISFFNIIISPYTSYDEGLKTEVYNFTEKSFSLFNINRD